MCFLFVSLSALCFTSLNGSTLVIKNRSEVWVNFLGTFPKHISHVSTYFRNQYFFGCFIAQMIWFFNVQLSTCWAYWATASSSAYPQCARKWGYTEPEPSRGLSQQSKTQRWCRHQQLKSYWRRTWNIPRFDYFAQIEAKVCEECQVFPFLSRTFPVTDIRCCFCILCSVRQPSLPNMRLKCKKFSMLNCTPWGKNRVSGILFVWIDMGWLVDPKLF